MPNGWMTTIGPLALGFLLVAGPAQAQEPAQGARRSWDQFRQDRAGDDRSLRRGSSDARELDRLLRMRERSQERVQRLRQPSQNSRPVRSNNSNKNTVITQ